MNLQEELTPEQVQELLADFAHGQALARLDRWRKEGDRRGYAIHTLHGGTVGVRLYQGEIIEVSHVDRTLAHAVQGVLGSEEQ